jgi:hypothetical protein
MIVIDVFSRESSAAMTGRLVICKPHRYAKPIRKETDTLPSECPGNMFSNSPSTKRAKPKPLPLYDNAANIDQMQVLLSLDAARQVMAGSICGLVFHRQEAHAMACTTFACCGKPFGCRFVAGIVDEALTRPFSHLCWSVPRGGAGFCHKLLIFILELICRPKCGVINPHQGTI